MHAFLKAGGAAEPQREREREREIDRRSLMRSSCMHNNPAKGQQLLLDAVAAGQKM
jgi:hypothetical protein